MIYKESMTSDFFMKWFSEELLPSLSETHVIVMDNATFHTKKQLDELCIEHHHFFTAPTSLFTGIKSNWNCLGKLKESNHRIITTIRIYKWIVELLF